MDFFIENLDDVNTALLIQAKQVVVGFDVGDKTVGIAVSDWRLRIATGISVIRRKGNEFCEIQKSLEGYNIGLIVFGWPVEMNGRVGAQCEKVEEFAKELRKYFGIPFARWDERLSTCAVTDVLMRADLSRKRRKAVVDKTAATYILQGALDFLNMRNPIAETDQSRL